MLALFGLAILILIGLGITKAIGFSNSGFLAQIALWFALGVLATPLLLLAAGCWALFSAG